MWSKIAEEMKLPWRAVEAMHWQMGEQEIGRRSTSVPPSLLPPRSHTRHMVDSIPIPPSPLPLRSQTRHMVDSVPIPPSPLPPRSQTRHMVDSVPIPPSPLPPRSHKRHMVDSVPIPPSPLPPGSHTGLRSEQLPSITQLGLLVPSDALTAIRDR
jgi:hypothetical protein